MEFDAVAQAKKLSLRHWGARVFSVAFLGLVAALSVSYFAIPGSKASQAVFTEGLYGMDYHGEGVYSESDVFQAMGISQGSLLATLNGDQMAEKLAGQWFVNPNAAKPKVDVTPFSLKVSFKDIFPIGVYNGKTYLSSGEALDSQSNDQNLRVASKAYEAKGYAYPLGDQAASLPLVTTDGDPKAVFPALSYLDAGIFNSGKLLGLRETDGQAYLYAAVYQSGETAVRARIRLDLDDIGKLRQDSMMAVLPGYLSGSYLDGHSPHPDEAMAGLNGTFYWLRFETEANGSGRSAIVWDDKSL